MGFGAALREGRFPVTLEITPPRTPRPRVLLRRARLLAGHTAAVNVIERPDRQSSLDAALALRAEGIEPVWHLVTAGRSREAIAADLARAAGGGIEDVLCIRGDHAAEAELTVREAVAMVATGLPGALVAAAFDQHHATERTRGFLTAKLEAGATCVWTQPVFDVAALEEAVGPVRDAYPRAHIVAMAMPLLAPDAAARIAERLHIPLPDALARRVAAGPAAAWEAFDETVAALHASEAVDGLAIMTFEADPPPETGERILQALRCAGIADGVSAR